MERTSWLLPEGSDRERMLDMDRRLQPVRRGAFGVLALAVLVCGPWMGWWTVVPVLVTAAVFKVADARVASARRPEVGMFAAWVATELIIAATVALTGGARVAILSWLAIPVVTLTARFSERAIAVGVAIALALLVAVAFGVDASAVLADPTVVVAPAALIVVTTLLCVPLMRSDVDHRAEAVVDPLTGMLNRKALAIRATELSQQSALTGQPVGVIVGDVDEFKRINDTSGHAQGDAVLAGVARVLRTRLRAFDLVYRYGGDEFLVLLPGADAAESVALAEDLRRSVEDQDVAGSRVTMSFGVSTSRRNGVFEWDDAFRAADQALYEAKRDGRNRVVAAGAPVGSAP